MKLSPIICLILLSVSIMTQARHSIIPDPIRPGDTIAIVSPAGIARAADVYGAAEVLQSRGYHVTVAPSALAVHGTYAGSDSARLADLRAAWLDPSVKAIICSRGGYGAVHLLDSLDAVPLAFNAKWLVGFSDITCLHSLMGKHDIASVHGPMCSYISRDEGRNPDALRLISLLEGADVIDYRVEHHELNRPGSATGRLVGGNLSVHQGLIGTPYDVIRPGTILIVEDIAEPIYKIERILWQLKMSGVLSQLAGLIVGDFTDYEPDPNHPTMEAMIADMVRDYTYPVAFGVPVGHDGRSLPLLLNAPVTLTVTDSLTTIRQCF